MKEIKLLGFNYTKLGVIKKEYLGKIDVKTDLNIENIEKLRSDYLNQEIIKVYFRFDVKFGELGEIMLEGNANFLAEPKLIKDIQSGWINKNLNDEYKITIINHLLQKCSVKAIRIEEDFGFPIHIRLPSVSVESKPGKQENPKQK